VRESAFNRGNKQIFGYEGSQAVPSRPSGKGGMKVGR
jgi:hypothetical protein